VEGKSFGGRSTGTHFEVRTPATGMGQFHPLSVISGLGIYVWEFLYGDCHWVPRAIEEAGSFIILVLFPQPI
jgi:hypothetical protein